MVHNPRAVIAMCLAGVVASGCASDPSRADRALARAEASVSQASVPAVQRSQAASLLVAQRKLEEAKQAHSKHRYDDAERLAQQAELEAQLAGAQARAGDAEKAVAEIDRSLSSLRDESTRGETHTGSP